VREVTYCDCWIFIPSHSLRFVEENLNTEEKQDERVIKMYQYNKHQYGCIDGAYVFLYFCLLLLEEDI
jgi:hypothetical protein